MSTRDQLLAIRDRYIEELRTRMNPADVRAVDFELSLLDRIERLNSLLENEQRDDVADVWVIRRAASL